MTGWIYPTGCPTTRCCAPSPAPSSTTTRCSRRSAAPVDPWFFDDQQGFGVDDVELSRDLTTVVGIAGQNDEKLRVYRTTMSPFGAPDWDHQPFYTRQHAGRRACYELDGKFESTTLAPSGGAMAYGTAEGVYVAAIPDGLRARRPGTLLVRRARASPTGARPTSRRRARSRRLPRARPTPAPAQPAKLKLSVARTGKVVVHRARPRPRERHLQAARAHDRLGEQDGQGRRQGHAEGQAQEALARQGDRQGRRSSPPAALRSPQARP